MNNVGNLDHEERNRNPDSIDDPHYHWTLCYSNSGSKMIFLDTETCGLHGLPVLIQWAEDDGPVNLFSPFKEPVQDTLDLIKKFTDSEICGFNLAFDWFHICKLYTIFEMLDPDSIPQDQIDYIAEIEPLGRDGPCVKPKAACDLMLLARKGPYQSLMDRKDIKIRRVPAVLASKLANELESRIQIDDIYFAKRKDKFAPKWKVEEIHKRDGSFDNDFRNVTLRFRASGGLKNLAYHALKLDETISHDEGGVDKELRPEELGWAPFALATGKPGKWNGAWPEVIRFHIDYWAFNPLGRKYAEQDVDLTRRLYYHFGSPEPGDVDSTLACMVGAVRWHGFKINVPAIRELRKKALAKSTTAPKAAAQAKAWLLEVMDEIEQVGLIDRKGMFSTAKPLLEAIARWEDHPAGKRARMILEARKAKKEVELYDKLIVAGRFHASFVVIGTLSSRMAGSDGLNPQGIKRAKEVRACFPLADDSFTLSGGDFESFEVVLADAVYNDPTLREELESGKKIHALFAMELFPGKSYEDILETKGLDTEYDLYGKGKNGVFAMIYGGDDSTLVNKNAIDPEAAKKAFDGFQKKHPGIRKARQKTFNDFCSMRQPKGIGTNVEWHEPKDYVESFLGFRRYFTLENKICKALFELANHPPQEWRDLKIKVQRREDKIQTAGGAVMSALYAAAFQIQAANMRAAANHEIQSPGAQITKATQAAVWSIQPAGIGEWIVIPMNVHDELMTPTKPGYEESVEKKVHETVDSFRDKVPLIKIDWSRKLTTWADK